MLCRIRQVLTCTSVSFFYCNLSLSRNPHCSPQISLIFPLSSAVPRVFCSASTFQYHTSRLGLPLIPCVILILLQILGHKSCHSPSLCHSSPQTCLHLFCAFSDLSAFKTLSFRSSRHSLSGSFIHVHCSKHQQLIADILVFHQTEVYHQLTVLP